MNIEYLFSEINILNNKIKNDYYLQLITIDDGSKDSTYSKLLEQKNNGLPYDMTIVKLLKNYGSYNAFLAGLHYADGDVCIQLHADLQDPPDKIPEMLEYWKKGEKLVIGLRTKRETNKLDNIFSELYHILVKSIALPNMPKGGFDLIVFDKQLKDEIVKRNELNTNVIYQIASLVDAYKIVPITRKKRIAGKSQWTLSKKLKLIADTVVSFSDLPIRLLSLMAILNIFISFFVVKFILDYEAPIKIKSLLIYFIIIINILIIGISIIGEYLYRTLEAARGRPPFVVDKVESTKKQN